LASISRLAENITASSIPYRETLRQAGIYFTAHGASAPDAQSRAVAWIAQTVATRSTYLAYIDVFAAVGLTYDSGDVFATACRSRPPVQRPLT
jgi:hypothetical protein